MPVMLRGQRSGLWAQTPGGLPALVLGQTLGRARPKSTAASGAVRTFSLGSVTLSCTVTCFVVPVCGRFGAGNTLALWLKKGLELSLRSMELL